MSHALEGAVVSHHILIIGLDADREAARRQGEAVFPEHPDERSYTLMCPDGNGCKGFLRCGEPHWFGGVPVEHDINQDSSAPRGYENEEREFHGVTHLWREGWGWTVPYEGCIVNYVNWEYPTGIAQYPIGEYDVEDEWIDDSCWVEFANVRPSIITAAS